MSDESLPPCPFCGGSRITVDPEHRTPADDTPVWRVMCRSCRKGDLASYGQKANAIAAWNMRPAHSEAQAEIERMRGLVREAYYEGYTDGINQRDKCFTESEAFKSLTPPSPTPNQQ